VLQNSFLQRNSRTILLNGIDFEGTLAISKSKVLLVGAGGISSSIISILASAGVGEVAIWDGDALEISNLQRQFIYKYSEIGGKKANLASKFIQDLNPDAIVTPFYKYLNEETAPEFQEIAHNFDAIVDGTDSFSSRSLCNKIALELKKPFFTGSCVGFEGQVYSFLAYLKENPCYACLFGADYTTFKEAKTCANSGVFPPLPAIVGSLISQNLLQFLAKKECNFTKFTTINFSKHNHFKELKIQKDAKCQICSNIKLDFSNFSNIIS
jgi:adenylyltransferase/sulfurtransferase